MLQLQVANIRGVNLANEFVVLLLLLAYGTRRPGRRRCFVRLSDV
jgi:hypothetical protein